MNNNSNNKVTKADMLRKLDADFKNDELAFERKRSAHIFSKMLTEEFGNDELYFYCCPSNHVVDGKVVYTVLPQFVNENLPVTKKLQILLDAVSAGRPLDVAHSQGTDHKFYKFTTDRHCNTDSGFYVSLTYEIEFESCSRHIIYFKEALTPDICATMYDRYKDSFEYENTPYNEKGTKTKTAADFLLHGTTERDYTIFQGGYKMLRDAQKVDELLDFIRNYDK